MAALLTSRSMPPYAATACSTIAAADSCDDTSVGTNSPPMSAATFWPPSASMSAATTDAPSAASARAYASPIPCAAPVTTATFPSNLMPTSSCWFGHHFRLQVLLEAGDAHLAADAGLLVAAERRVRAEPHAAVDRERAGADAAGHRLRPREVGRVDRAREAVRRLVGDPD